VAIFNDKHFLFVICTLKSQTLLSSNWTLYQETKKNLKVMLKKQIKPLDLSTLTDSEIENRLKNAFEDFVTFWEKHGPIILTRVPYKELSYTYSFIVDGLNWLEGNKD